jgi:hypothetical protein
MTRTIPWLVAAALLALGACTKKSENPPPPMSGSGNTMATGSDAPPSAPGSGTMATGSGSRSPSAAGSAAAAPEVDVPTEMDFEDDATAKITDKNVEAQVKAIEKELEQK